MWSYYPYIRSENFKKFKAKKSQKMEWNNFSVFLLKWITKKKLLSIFSSFGADKKLVKPDFINEDTIITLDPDTGKALSSFGKGLFLMPHGLTIDNEGNHYVTDVGLHQVMRVCNFPLHYTTYVMQWPNSRPILFWIMHPTT